MAAEIFDFWLDRLSYIGSPDRISHNGMSLQIKAPTLRCKPLRRQIQTRPNLSVVKQIDLNFKVQLKYNEIQVFEESSRNGTAIISEHRTPQHSFASCQLPVSIFKNGDKSLERYLLQQFEQFEMYADIINVQLVANEIIKYWSKRLEEEEEDGYSRFEKIYPLEIIIELWIMETADAVEAAVMMVPTSDSAMEKMLKRVEVEDDESNDCVICMEEMSKEEEGESERMVLQMPCMHVFHGDCIHKWLSTSHYCPICRFSMPTNNYINK